MAKYRFRWKNQLTDVVPGWHFFRLNWQVKEAPQGRSTWRSTRNLAATLWWSHQQAWPWHGELAEKAQEKVKETNPSNRFLDKEFNPTISDFCFDKSFHATPNGDRPNRWVQVTCSAKHSVKQSFTLKWLSYAPESFEVGGKPPWGKRKQPWEPCHYVGSILYPNNLSTVWDLMVWINAMSLSLIRDWKTTYVWRFWNTSMYGGCYIFKWGEWHEYQLSSVRCRTSTSKKDHRLQEPLCIHANIHIFLECLDMLT